LSDIDAVDDIDDARTEVLTRPPFECLPPPPEQPQPLTLRPVSIPQFPSDFPPDPRTAPTAKVRHDRSARPPMSALLGASLVVTVCSLAFAFSSRNGGEQCLATGAPIRVAPLAVAVAPLASPPPAAIPTVAPAAIPETTFDALPVARPSRPVASPTRVARPTATSRVATATPIPKAAPSVAAQAPAAPTRPLTEAEAARDAAALARAQLEAALR
jgi:N-acetylmuramoyl-L-alanine amidase